MSREASGATPELSSDPLAEFTAASGPSFETPRLEELLPPDALRELAASFRAMCGLDVWVRSTSGADLVGSAGLLPEGGDGLLSVDVASGDVVRREGSVTYLVGPIEYDHDLIGRVVVGPFSASSEAKHQGNGDSKLPTMSVEKAQSFLAHLRLSLDLISHARQRAHFAASMHLASIEESYQELLRKNAALEEAFSRLKELDHLKSSFLATVSHELRTPLTSIIGYSEMRSEGMCGPLTKEQLEFVQTIRQKGDQLLRLILSLLDLSKLESGTLRMHPIAVPIEAVLNDAITTLGPAAGKKGVKLLLEPSQPVPYIKADPDRLRQVFVNLVDNAVKFTPKGGVVSLGVKVAEAPPAEGGGMVLLAPMRRELEVRVKDSGIGIPHHERNRVFDPFYQVDQSSTREQGGAGLGLAIVKRIVEAHQGRIRVEDNEPNGATFVVTFPLMGSNSSGARPRVEAP